MKKVKNEKQEVCAVKKVKTVEVKTVAQVKVGTVEVFVSQASHETIRMDVSQGVLDEIFVPQRQTHQVSVVRGKVVLVVWIDQKPQDIYLDETSSQVVVIPSNVRYGFINLHQEPSVVINAVLHDQGSDYHLEHYPVDEPIVYGSAVVEHPVADYSVVEEHPVVVSSVLSLPAVD